MEFFTQFLPLVNGGITIIFCFLFYSIYNLKKDLERDVSNFRNYRKKTEANTKFLDNRIRHVENFAARRWTTFTPYDEDSKRTGT